MTDQERNAMEMALRAFQSCRWDCDENAEPHKTFNDILVSRASEALHAALAQPEQAPVGMTCKVWTHGCALFDGIDLPNETLLYTAPPSKPWVSLTFEEIKNIWVANYHDTDATDAFAYAIEAKLKEKNNG